MNKDLQVSVDALALRNVALQEEIDTLKRQMPASTSSSSPSLHMGEHAVASTIGEGAVAASTILEGDTRKKGKGSDDEEDCVEISSRISMRKELANLIDKYELLQSHHHGLSKKYSASCDRFKKFKSTYNDLRRHCYLIEEDKKALLEHAKWQEGQISSLQRDMQELHKSNIKSQILIDDLKKENNILQINAAERKLVADADLQAKYEALQKKMDVRSRQCDEACGVILELRSKLKRMEKKYDKIREENIILNEFSKKRFCNMQEMQREQATVLNQLNVEQQNHVQSMSFGEKNDQNVVGMTTKECGIGSKGIHITGEFDSVVKNSG